MLTFQHMHFVVVQLFQLITASVYEFLSMLKDFMLFMIELPNSITFKLLSLCYYRNRISKLCICTNERKNANSV